MDRDIYENQEMENGEYIQGKYQNNFNSGEEDENKNYDFLNQGQMSGVESNKEEVFKNQNDNDINELDVSLNDNNNEFNSENIHHEDEGIDNINNELDNDINEVFEEPMNNMENDVINNNNINMNMDMGDENNYINNDMNNNFINDGYNNSINEDANNMNMNNNDVFEENEENINNDNKNYFGNVNTINNLKNIESMNYNLNYDNNNMNYFNNINNYNNRNLNMNNNFESIEEDLNNMNNINLKEELIYNEGEEENENEDSKLSLINSIKDIKYKFIGLEKKFNKVKEENQKLRQELEQEKIKNRNMAPNKAQIYENCLKQGNILINDIRNKNNILNSKINDLESKNKSLNYQLIEANKKIKKLEDDLKQKINVSNVNNDIGENKDNNALNEIKMLKKKVYDNEVTISKLNYDKKKLGEKIENMKKEYKNKMNLMINYKNSEINTLKKYFKNYKEYYNNININTNMSNNNIDFNKNDNGYEEELRLELANKDKIIANLNSKINYYINKLNNTFEISQLCQKNIEKLERHNQKLKNDKQKLSKILEQTKRANNPLNNEIFANMENKLLEYKKKIVILKRKINELYDLKKSDINYNKSPFSNGHNEQVLYNTAHNFYNPSL